MRRRKGVRRNFKEGLVEEFSNKEGESTRGLKAPRLQLSLRQTRPSPPGSAPPAHFLQLALRKAAKEKPLAGRRLPAPRCYLLSHKTCAPHTGVLPTHNEQHTLWQTRATVQRTSLRLTVQRSSSISQNSSGNCLKLRRSSLSSSPVNTQAVFHKTCYYTLRFSLDSFISSLTFRHRQQYFSLFAPPTSFNI